MKKPTEDQSVVVMKDLQFGLYLLTMATIVFAIGYATEGEWLVATSFGCNSITLMVILIRNQ